jgi:hypothetical protein
MYDSQQPRGQGTGEPSRQPSSHWPDPFARPGATPTPPPMPPQWGHSQPPAQPWQPVAAPQQYSYLSIGCLVCAVAGWTFLPGLGTLVAGILYFLARQELKAANGRLQGGKLATIGIIIAGVQFALAALGILGMVLLIVLRVVLSGMLS